MQSEQHKTVDPFDSDMQLGELATGTGSVLEVVQEPTLFHFPPANAAAGAPRLVVLDIPEGAEEAAKPAPDTEQARVVLVNRLLNREAGVPVGAGFTDYAITQFNAIQGDRGHVYGHKVVKAVFGAAIIQIFPLNNGGSESKFNQNRIRFNPTEIVTGVGADAAAGLGHEFIHFAAGIGDDEEGNTSERLVTNGDNHLRWEMGKALRKNYTGMSTGGFYIGEKFLPVVYPVESSKWPPQ